MSEHHLPRVLAMLADVAALQVRLTEFAQELGARVANEPAPSSTTIIEFPVASSRETSRTPSKDASDPCDGEGSVSSSAGPGFSGGSEEESAVIAQDDNEVVSDDQASAAPSGEDSLPSPVERDEDEDDFDQAMSAVVQSVQAKPAAAVKSSTYERALDTYRDTTLSAAGIASQIGCPPSTVSVYVSIGRKAGDARAIDGDEARQKLRQKAKSFKKHVHTDPVETRGVEQPARFRLPSASPTRLPAPPTVAAVPETAREPVADFDPENVVVADTENLRLQGPLGDLDVTRQFVETVAHMVRRDGVYDTETLKEAGSWSSADSMKMHFSAMKPRLLSIGVELVTVSKDLFKLRRLES